MVDNTTSPPNVQQDIVRLLTSTHDEITERVRRMEMRLTALEAIIHEQNAYISELEEQLGITENETT